MPDGLCATKHCGRTATHKATVKDGTGELFTAELCVAHADHHREVDRIRRHPSLMATATSDPPDWWLVSIDALQVVS